MSVLAMLGAMLIGALAVAGPAQADPPPLFSVSQPPEFTDFHPGDPAQTISFTVTDAGEQTVQTLNASMTMTPADDFTISVSGCTPTGASSCKFDFSQSSAVTVKFTVQENANVTDIAQGTSAGYNMAVNFSDANPPQVLKGSGNIFGMPKPVVVNGAVYDSSTGKVVGGALVKLIDDTNAIFTATTGNDGKFSFVSTASAPIIGQLSIGASKTNYTTVAMTIPNGAATTNLHLNLDPKAAPSASPTDTLPAAGLSAGAPSSGAGAVTLAGTDSNAAAAASGGGSGTSLILIGGLILVLCGAGAIGFIFFRRKKNDAGGTPVPVAGGDPYSPRGGGRGPDRTMVAPGLGDAPTMMHRPVVDEYADPYAAPRSAPPSRPAGPPRQPGYAQQPAYGQPGYGQQPGYDQNRYPSSQQPTAYEQQGGHQPGYDGRYEQPDGYHQQGGNAYPPANGYQQGGYQEPAPTPATRRPVDPYGPTYPPAAPGYAAEPTTYGAYPGSPAAPAGYGQHQQGAGYQTEAGYATPDRGGYQPSGPTYPPADQGYGGQAPPTPQYGGGGYQLGGQPPAQPGYGGQQQQGGYPPANGYQGQQGGYQQGGHHQPEQYPQEQYPPTQPYAEEPYGQPAQPGYPQGGGYRGGYTPPDQRGAVDWLDD